MVFRCLHPPGMGPDYSPSSNNYDTGYSNSRSHHYLFRHPYSPTMYKTVLLIVTPSSLRGIPNCLCNKNIYHQPAPGRTVDDLPVCHLPGRFFSILFCPSFLLNDKPTTVVIPTDHTSTPWFLVGTIKDRNLRLDIRLSMGFLPQVRFLPSVILDHPDGHSHHTHSSSPDGSNRLHPFPPSCQAQLFHKGNKGRVRLIPPMTAMEGWEDHLYRPISGSLSSLLYPRFGHSHTVPEPPSHPSDVAGIMMAYMQVTGRFWPYHHTLVSSLDNLFPGWHCTKLIHLCNFSWRTTLTYFAQYYGTIVIDNNDPSR